MSLYFRLVILSLFDTFPLPLSKIWRFIVKCCFAWTKIVYCFSYLPRIDILPSFFTISIHFSGSVAVICAAYAYPKQKQLGLLFLTILFSWKGCFQRKITTTQVLDLDDGFTV